MDIELAIFAQMQRNIVSNMEELKQLKIALTRKIKSTLFVRCDFGISIKRVS